MTLDALALTIAGRLVTRRWRRNTARGHRHHDDAILRWTARIRATPVAKELDTSPRNRQEGQR